MVGTGANTYTLAGVSSGESNVAQSGPLRFVTADSAGNLGTSTFDPASVAALDGRVGSLEGRVGSLEGRVGSLDAGLRELRREGRRGVAAAMAMTTAPMPSLPGKTTWAMNYANFRGESAIGGSFAYRLDTTVPIALTAGYSWGGGNNHGIRVGAQGEF
jgi:trimeric autotransporter adhesin